MKKARKRHQNLCKEEKEKKQQYGCERYKSLSENKKKKGNKNKNKNKKIFQNHKKWL